MITIKPYNHSNVQCDSCGNVINNGSVITAGYLSTKKFMVLCSECTKAIVDEIAMKEETLLR